MPNRLAQETSPYLRQHADNPVDWYPWGEEALTNARVADRPILLSIGYSACHWCHVMAHESFEDSSIAAVMNRLFVNIKVDREERPDLDQIYQTAHQMLTRRAGGWPLTMFLTPDGTPFFGGTYFPKSPQYGLPGFQDLLVRVEAAYRTQREAIAEQNSALLETFKRSGEREDLESVPLDRSPIEALHRLLAASFDPVHGGFGQAPKFPHTTDLDFLLRISESLGLADARAMVVTTLERMAEGGIYDQLGGGFCRYSVDDRWNIPHFEKMLYDNGPLLGTYADAWALTGRPLFARVVEETAAWTMREMQAPDGGFYSSLDADSEHVEGKFYVWDRTEVERLLGQHDYPLVAAHFGFDAEPNFEGRHWHPFVAQPVASVAARLGYTLEACELTLEHGRARLFRARSQRVRPGLDDKVLTSWNALMISGMTRAARIFGRGDWLDSARRATHYLRTTLWQGEIPVGRLLATAKDGRAHLNAYLDDYAFLLAATIELLQASFRSEDLAFARAIADAMLERFEDKTHGGFFFTSHDHEMLMHRPKTGYDNATPSGNAVAALSLQRLHHITGDLRYGAASTRTIERFRHELAKHPSGFATMACALEESLVPPTLVILRGPAQETAGWTDALNRRYLPGTLVLAIAPDVPDLPASLDKPAASGVNAYLCSGVHCLPTIGSQSELQTALSVGRLL